MIHFGLGVIIPSILLAAILGILLVRQEQETFRRAALDQNRSFMMAVDAEISGHILTLRGLGTSRNLDTGDLSAFREEAIRVLGSQEDWRNIALATPSGQQLVNTAGSPETQGVFLIDMESANKAVRTGRPAVGKITLGWASREYGIPLRIPIMRNGSVEYLLSAVLKLQAFDRLIKARNLGKAWVAGLVDNTGHFIARVPPLPPTDVGSNIFTEAIKKNSEGWYRGVTLDGFDTFTAHRTSEFTGWSIGMAFPVSEVNAAAYRAAWLVGIGGIAAIGLTVLLAYWLGAQIAKPVASLAAAARLIGSDNIPVQLAAHSGIREVRAVANALAESAKAVRDRQQAIDREQATLIAADRAKDEFLAMLGHELRNPLSAVRNAASLLSRPSISDDNRAAAQAIINRQTEQLTRLVDDLLEVGRVVAGKIHLEKSPVDMVEVVDAAISAIKSTGRADGHRIAVHASGAALVLGDRSRLEQVVGNLAANAVSYTPANGAIDVSIKQDAGFVNLSVTDTGVGLKEEDQEAVFGLFYQADKSLHRSGGLGIGLTLVKRIVEMHNGTVSAQSRGLGKGSTFTVRLPSLAKASSAQPAARSASTVAPLDILVVDDSEDSRESLRLLLESEGHRVKIAIDGESGVSSILANKPAIAIVDIGMPRIDGYEVARQVRSQARIPIVLIALTGYGQPDDVRRAIDAGFDAHIVKPADIATLSEMLAKLHRTHLSSVL
ncbi:MAG: ATP-binding protein [Betaproteobacteria bacterium]